MLDQSESVTVMSAGRVQLCLARRVVSTPSQLSMYVYVHLYVCHGWENASEAEGLDKSGSGYVKTAMLLEYYCLRPVIPVLVLILPISAQDIRQMETKYIT